MAIAVYPEILQGLKETLEGSSELIGDLDADTRVRARAREMGQDARYEYAVTFRVIEV
jgi:hypothetical protein